MGRKKIKIQPIKEDRNRSVTYLKRKAGLFKKAHELAVLTDSQVAVIVFGHNGKLAEFCSTDIDLLLLRYTEYEGVAERKGPHNYLNNDKDSDDNDDDNKDNDNDDASGDGPDDDGSATNPGRGADGGGGGNGSNVRSVSGVKRKAEQPSPPRRSHHPNGSAALAGGSNLLDGFGSASGSTSTSSTAKQTVNAAIRQKNLNRSSATPALSGSIPSQTAFNPMSIGQPFVTGAGMPNNMGDGASHHMGVMMSAQTTTGFNNGTDGQGMTSSASTNPTRAEAIANMSIPMPANDRLSMFVSPATPGFGFTPGGSIVTPGGRRFSFSDVLTRGSSNSMMQRPVTASSSLVPTYFQNDAFSLAAAQPPVFSTISPSMSPQPPHGKSALTITSAATLGGKGPTQGDGLLQPPGVTMSASPTPFADARSGAHAMVRPASTGEARSVAPTHKATAYAASLGPTMTPSNTMASAAHIVRPLTAAANLELLSTSGHLVLPIGNFAQSLQATSASPMPHTTGLNATGMMNSAFDASSFVGTGFKTSTTPFGDSQTSSATPELISHGNSASAARGGIGASASRSSLSTDEETPPVHVGGRAGAPIGNAAAFTGHNAKLEMNAAWLHLGPGMDAKADQNSQASATLVQPQPINPTQTLGSVPFDLNFPAQPTK